jgi:predicted nucleic acid-binding protein
MERVSIITRNQEQQEGLPGAEVRDRTGNKADEGAAVGAASGGALGGIAGLLVGLGTLAIPGIGPIMLAGAAATTIATTIAGGAIGAAAGGLVGALVGLGIPEERARAYQERVARGDYLIMMDGTEAEIAKAEAILHRQGVEDYGVYDAPHAARAGASDESIPLHEIDPTVRTTPGMPQDYGRQRRAIGTFAHRRDAEAALTELKQSGFSMNQVSIIGKDVDSSDRVAGMDTNPAEGTKVDEGAKAGAATGATIGGLGGLLVGLGTLAIPGVGPVIAGGAAATALATALSGGAIGGVAGGLGGALVGLGIPEDRARMYSDRISHGEYLVMVDGSENEIRQAEALLQRRGIRDWGIYDASDATTSRRMGDRVDPYGTPTRDRLI